MASAGGLVVYKIPNTQRFAVCNLLTKATKTIAGLQEKPKEPLWTALANPVAGFYQVILMYKGERQIMNVYDSRTQRWELKVRNSDAPCVKIADEDMFVLDRMKGEMLTYNAERCMWSTVKTTLPSSTSRGHAGRALNLVLETILKCKGRVLLGGALEDNGTIYCLAIWEWKPIGPQGNLGRWVELARTPPEHWEPYETFCDPKWEWNRLYCAVANDNLICMIGGEDVQENLDELEEPGKYWPPLAYDLDRGCWQRLPLCGDEADYMVMVIAYQFAAKKACRDVGFLLKALQKWTIINAKRHDFRSRRHLSQAPPKNFAKLADVLLEKQRSSI